MLDSMKARTKKKKESTETEVLPLKSWRIVQNDYDIIIKENEKIMVPNQFLETLKTEGVI